MKTILSFQCSGWRMQLTKSNELYMVYLNRRIILRGTINECLNCFREYIVIATQTYYPSKFQNVKNDNNCQK